MPFVVVREDDEWRVHLDRTGAMMMSGSPDGSVEDMLAGALEVAADAMTEVMGGVARAMSSAADPEFEEALTEFDETARPRLEKELSSALGARLTLEVDWSGA